MNERQIEAALVGLGGQMPRAPAITVENMVKTVKMLNRERAKRTGIAPEPQTRRRELKTGTPVKNNNKVL